MERRSFVQLLLGSPLIGELSTLKGLQESPVKFWKKLRKQYPDSSSDWLNFNNGSAGMVSSLVLKAYKDNLDLMNQTPPYYYLIDASEQIEELKNGLASVIETSGDNISILRNTTEAINYVTQGIVLKEGVQILAASHDYPYAVNCLNRTAERTNSTLKVIELPMPCSEDQILSTYESHLKDNTSLLLLTAQTHREGQILPIKKLIALAKKYNALTLVDGAHSYGQYPHSVLDWDCDFYCTSLHKWFGAPHGSGILYIKKDKIKEVKGPVSCPKPFAPKMDKFTYIGTRSFAQEIALAASLELFNSIGIQNKFDRYKEMTKYWSDALSENKNIEIIKAENYGAIASFNVGGKATPFRDYLKKNKIHLKTVRSPIANRTSYRVSPGIYHNHKDLDRFINVVNEYRI